MAKKFFDVWAHTSTRVNGDGSLDDDYNILNDNTTKYVVEEYDEDGVVFSSKEYDVWEFDKIKEDHPMGEWQNNDW